MAITLVLTLALGVAEQELPPTEAVAPDAEPTEEYMYLRATLVNSASPRNYSEFTLRSTFTRVQLSPQFQRNYSDFRPVHAGAPTSAPTATTGTATTAASAPSTTSVHSAATAPTAGRARARRAASRRGIPRAAAAARSATAAAAARTRAATATTATATTAASAPSTGVSRATALPPAAALRGRV